MYLAFFFLAKKIDRLSLIHPKKSETNPVPTLGLREPKIYERNAFL